MKKALIILMCHLWIAAAFTPPKLQAHPRTHLHSSHESPEPLVDPNPQCLRSFLTQRCLQSFMFLLASTRDLHTVRYLDNLTKPVIINNYWDDNDGDANPGVGDAFREGDKRLGSKLLNYHGLSAINTTIFPHWDSFFTTLLEQPDTVLLIRTPTDLGRRAYSEFDIDISPARLCSRMLSVREQIAKELVGDLKAISGMGQQIFDSYNYNLNTKKDEEKSGGKKGGIGYKDGSSPRGFDRPSMLYMNFDPIYLDQDFAPSPLRKGNFDLLYNLITQSAVVDILQNGLQTGVYVGENEGRDEACLRYLEQFYKERVITHFVGAQFYGKGDDFIEEMMLKPNVTIFDDMDMEEDNSPVLEIEPMRIAEQILKRRDKMAMEWVEVMEGVPGDHTEIRKLQLARMMGQEGDKITVTDQVMLAGETDEFQ